MLNLNATQINQIKTLIDDLPVGVYHKLELVNKIAKFYVPRDNEARLWGHSDIVEMCFDALVKTGYCYNLHLSLNSKEHFDMLVKLQSFVNLDNSKIFCISTQTTSKRSYQNFIFANSKDTLLKLKLFL